MGLQIHNSKTKLMVADRGNNLDFFNKLEVL